MKKLLLLPALSLALFACNVAGDEDYEALAKDACGCINESTGELSDEMIKVIVDADGDQAKLEELMGEYMAADPSAAMKDVQAMQGSMVQDMTTCMEGLEKKYDDVYSTDSEEEVQKKIMEKLEAMDDCKSSVAIMKLGLNAQ